ncbi:MAG: type II toxin-antitoxin system HipA family toxin [Paracoccaceae bacterium]|nr:type II toxin-antitoxin system HipA family toxin [Paracoccaceae bacterium]
MAEANVALGESKRAVGRLHFEADGRRQHSLFEYADEWLAANDAFALSPSLPLQPGGYHSSAREDRRAALAGCFSDAAPDSWGRALMTKALGGGLTEFDYLVLSDDHTKQGALRFLDDNQEPLSRLNPPVPRLVDLKHLRGLALRYEQDPGGAEEEARDLAGVAGSLGGARPKANVEGGGHLWIAKFTSAHDTKPVERVEVATAQLAAKCGIRVAEARLELRESANPVAIFRRFDRRGAARIPYISARTALGWQGDEGGFYTDIADVIRQISSKPVDDLNELWRRIVFTILVFNKDNHLKNHGFIYVGGGQWRLSPAFDINPAPERHRVLETGIIAGGSFDASIDIALEACEFFDFKPEEARAYASNAARTIRETWKEALKNEGVSAQEVKQYTDAFEHRDSEKALQWHE